MSRRSRSWLVAILCSAVLTVASNPADAQSAAVGPDQLIGTWRGTSLCTDRVAAPACQDETVVYEFTPGSPPGAVHWLADKVVNGERDRMGEFDLTYDTSERCWKVEFSTPRVNGVWCLTVNGARLSGTLRLLPGQEIVRRVDLTRHA